MCGRSQARRPPTAGPVWRRGRHVRRSPGNSMRDRPREHLRLVALNIPVPSRGGTDKSLAIANRPPVASMTTLPGSSLSGAPSSSIDIQQAPLHRGNEYIFQRAGRREPVVPIAVAPPWLGSSCNGRPTVSRCRTVDHCAFLNDIVRKKYDQALPFKPAAVSWPHLNDRLNQHDKRQSDRNNGSQQRNRTRDSAPPGPRRRKDGPGCPP